MQIGVIKANAKAIHIPMKSREEVCLANALNDSMNEESTYPQQRLISNSG